MIFDLLASGSRGNAFLLRDEAMCVLIDCGGTRRWLLQCLKEKGVSLKEIDALLVTHDHTDHVSQISLFKDIPVWSPVDLSVPTVPVRADHPFLLGHLSVYPLALSHDAEATVGYIIENGTEKLVYVTDTGYVKDGYLSLMRGADYIVLESNHDPDLLMHTGRPYYVKRRILSDAGHLCNEDACEVLDAVVTPRTRMIILAHISQEANTREAALKAAAGHLLKYHRDLNRSLIISAAGQFEPIHGGNDEKVDPGTVFRAVGMECMAERTDRKDG
ncbi:MAG: MBL fold metallo-hydrolase [Solobacterium sp.]|nr:MBL fold metallo-hydrolase [Solobacterium sp.]